MYAGEDGEVCVELGYLGKGISTSKVAQPDKSKAGGLPVRVDGNRFGALICLCVTIMMIDTWYCITYQVSYYHLRSTATVVLLYPMFRIGFDACL